MKKNIRVAALFLAAMLGASVSVFAKSPDYSGVYDCKGKDAAEGDYTATITLTLNKAQSAEGYGAYDFKMEVPDFGTYPGEAVAKGDKLAIFFGLDKPGSQDHGTGLATVKKNAKGQWTFRKFYYEREYKGGNHGTESCVKR